MKKLTLYQLKVMKPHKIFASGTEKDAPGGINMTNSGNNLDWIATRGGTYDWAIYCYWEGANQSYIVDMGDKVHDAETIKRLVPATDEAYEMYRH